MYSCYRCTYCWTSEQEGVPRTWLHYNAMAEMLIKEYGSDSKFAKKCYGVTAQPIIQFDDPNRAFPIAAVHTQLGLRINLLINLQKSF